MALNSIFYLKRADTDHLQYSCGQQLARRISEKLHQKILNVNKELKMGENTSVHGGKTWCNKYKLTQLLNFCLFFLLLKPEWVCSRNVQHENIHLMFSYKYCGL